MVVSRSVYMVRLVPGSYIVPGTPITVSGGDHTATLSSTCKKVRTRCRNPPQKRLLLLMQLVLHATRRTPRGASRSVQATFAWSVKIRRTPSRRCRDARVYVHTTTAMHDNEYTPPAPWFNPLLVLTPVLLQQQCHTNSNSIAHDLSALQKG